MGGDSVRPDEDSSQIQFRLEGMEVDQFSFDKQPEHTNFEQGGYTLHHGLTAARNDDLILVRVIATLQSAMEGSDEELEEHEWSYSEGDHFEIHPGEKDSGVSTVSTDQLGEMDVSRKSSLDEEHLINFS